jgi:hypothetical protein
MNEAFDPFDDRHVEGPLFPDDTYEEIGGQAEAYLAASALVSNVMGLEAREFLAVTSARVAGATARENIREVVEASQMGTPIQDMASGTKEFIEFVGDHFGEQHAAQLRYLRPPEASPSRIARCVSVAKGLFSRLRIERP